MVPEELFHPDAGDVELPELLAAVADPVRLSIVERLSRVGVESCGAINADLAVHKSTLSHHYRVLREAGITRTSLRGRQRFVQLRAPELAERFPGVLDSIIASAARPDGDGIRLRLASAHDLELIADLVSAGSRRTRPRAAAEFAPLLAERECWLAEREGRAVGVVVVSGGEHELVLDRLVLGEGGFGERAGEVLLRAVAERARIDGYAEVRIRMDGSAARPGWWREQGYIAHEIDGETWLVRRVDERAA
ncbi:ArsR/SmtB family transcription factor [Naumannella huperziae]